MKIGFIGLGKLGLPCSLSIEGCGHTVFGVEPSASARNAIGSRKIPYAEAGAQQLLSKSEIRLVDFEYLVREAEIIFIAVQTPHGPLYEGVTPIPETRSDFDYSALCRSIHQLCDEISKQDVVRNVVIISTVLPGSIRRHIRPIIKSRGLTEKIKLAYNPFFIAMGTAIRDFLHPEFVLIGVDSEDSADALQSFYGTIHSRPTYRTTVENAELIKVAYNTFIGMKIVFANTIMEICHKTPKTDCDAVIGALSMASDRLISPKYLRGGMGDGGGCHPRDNIAMSWLAHNLHLSHDFFSDLMSAREDQTGWLVELVSHESSRMKLPIVLLGKSFKPNTNISVGSPAILLSNMLTGKGVAHTVFDPMVDSSSVAPCTPAVFFVATQHDCWLRFAFPEGSVILDPFRYLEENQSVYGENTVYIPIGRCQI